MLTSILYHFWFIMEYPDVDNTSTLDHQRDAHSGPLVLGTALHKFPTPAIDREQTVSRRSEPSSRTALMGEQPNPWNQGHLSVPVFLSALASLTPPLPP